MQLTSLAMAGSSVIVGLNGALQKRFIIDSSLIPGDVHRAAEIQTGVGGKGQDVCMTLSCLQYSDPQQVVQFVGSGAEGDTVYAMLREILGEDSLQLTVRPESGMRTCTSIVGPDSTTELVEPSGMISSSEMDELISKLKGVEAGALCIMGSMPPGCQDSTYADIYAEVATPTTLCLIDSVNGLEPLLTKIRETPGHGPTILKVNASELCKLADVKKSTSEMGGVLTDELIDAITKFLKKFQAVDALSAIAVTDGAHSAHMAVLGHEDNEFRLFQLPVADLKDDKFLNLFPIGAGDSVAAGTLAAWKSLVSKEPSVPVEIQQALEGNESPSSRVMLAAFAFGLACGSASCLQEQNSVLKVDDALRLYNREGRPAFISSHAM